MKLLVVEDNAALLDMIAEHLREQGFVVDAVGTGTAALQAMRADPYDAIILDLGLPDIDGMDVLRGLPPGTMPPTLVLTARDGIAHRIAGLDAGADDYILKPFDLAEFDARLRAVLRRPGSRDATCPSFGDLTYDAANRAARVADRSTELTSREATLLDTLIRAGDRITVRDTLADRLYGPDEPFSDNALEASVSRLRRKLATLSATTTIETIRGIGYRLHPAR